MEQVCPKLVLSAPDSYLDLGHKVKAMMHWVSDHLPGFDFLLKTDLDTLICFHAVTDLLDAVQLRFRTSQRIYLGHFETCSKIRHNPHERFYDPAYQADILLREDALCYPPYMQGLGYVLSRDLVQTIGAMWRSLNVYTNEDMSATRRGRNPGPQSS